MDDNRFDSLARSIATTGSRRTLLRSALSLLGGALGITYGTSAATAHGNKGKDNDRDDKPGKGNDQDKCVRDGKTCKKHRDCCSDICVDNPRHNKKGTCCGADADAVTCAGKCGPQTNNCGVTVECGLPDDDAITCAGKCGPQINNCGTTVECEVCPREACTETDICAEEGLCLGGTCCPQGDICEDEFCCPEDRAPTHACCPGTGRCCDCFKDNANGAISPFYCDCPSSRVLCGTFPNDACCQSYDGCVDGVCVATEYICPPSSDPAGDNIHCHTACCGDVCCPPGQECDGNQNCVPQLAICTSDDQCSGTSRCTAYWEDDAGICCPGHRYYEHVEPDGTDGETILVKNCCFQGEKAQDCDQGFCFPVHYGLCSSTFRGTQPRVRP